MGRVGSAAWGKGDIRGLISGTVPATKPRKSLHTEKSVQGTALEALPKPIS